jgi:hypothetical protein
MSEHPYIEQNVIQRLRAWVLAEMFRGAWYAFVFIASIGVILGAIWAVGLLLPEDSKNAPPPMPYSQLQATVQTIA